MRRGFKRERLLGRMTDGWCKGERKGGKLGKQAVLNNIQSPEGPLKQQGDETSCACWQWNSPGTMQL